MTATRFGPALSSVPAWVRRQAKSTPSPMKKPTPSAIAVTGSRRARATNGEGGGAGATGLVAGVATVVAAGVAIVADGWSARPNSAAVAKRSAGTGATARWIA